MNKKRVIILLSFLFIFLIFVTLFKIMNPKPQIQQINYEYGQECTIVDQIDSNAKDIDMSSLIYEDGKDYLKIGEHVLTYKINFTKYIVNILVSDTTPPTIEGDDIIEVEMNTEDYNFAEHFNVTDLGDVQSEFDLSKVDFSSEGSYDAMIRATDASSNSSDKTFTVNIFKPVENEPIVEDNSIGKNEQIVQNSSGGDVFYYVNGILVVNKKHGLPADYAPGENAEAGNQVRAFIKEMQNLGYNISSSYSGYRSYEYQASLYNSYVAIDGQAVADTYSARPGYSEHQSGYAFDLLDNNGQLVESAPEVKYIAENAWRYGFIVRYIKAKEAITGYREETWHIRYVGDQAKAIYDSGLTLEEYLGIEGGDYLNP